MQRIKVSQARSPSFREGCKRRGILRRCAPLDDGQVRVTRYGSMEAEPERARRAGWNLRGVPLDGGGYVSRLRRSWPCRTFVPNPSGLG
jgi:hypothetical protein